MQTSFRLRATMLLVLLAFGLAPVKNAGAEAANLQGTYVLDDPSALQDIKRAVDKVADRMGLFVAAIARGRLMDANKPANTIVISIDGNMVTTQFDQDQAIRAPLADTSVEWRRDDGERVTVKTRWQDGALKRSIASKDATRTNTFILDASGKMLTLHVRIVSEHLPRPLIYELIYRRAN